MFIKYYIQNNLIKAETKNGDMISYPIREGDDTYTDFISRLMKQDIKDYGIEKKCTFEIGVIKYFITNKIVDFRELI